MSNADERYEQTPHDADESRGPKKRIAKKAAKTRKRNPSQKRDQQKILLNERKKRALEMRKAGASHSLIAEQLDVSSATVATMLGNAIKELTLEPAEDLRKLQLERLNHMLMALWPQVTAGNVGASSMAERLIARMNALTGVEAPVKVQASHSGAVLVIDGNQEEYIENLKRMAGYLPPDEHEALTGEKKPVAEITAGSDSGNDPSPEQLEGQTSLFDQLIPDYDDDDNVIVDAEIIEDDEDDADEEPDSSWATESWEL